MEADTRDTQVSRSMGTRRHQRIHCRRYLMFLPIRKASLAAYRLGLEKNFLAPSWDANTKQEKVSARSWEPESTLHSMVTWGLR